MSFADEIIPKMEAVFEEIVKENINPHPQKLIANYVQFFFGKYKHEVFYIAHFIKPYRDPVHLLTFFFFRQGFMKLAGPFHKTLPK